MEPVVKINNVSKTYSKKTVLDNISINIENGQIYGLIGPSGAGKTTLVKIMVGMEKADTGTAHVLDVKMPNLNVMQDIGYMAQSDALYLDLTGEENLQFFASLFRINKADQKKRISYVAELVNLTDHLKKKVSAYSGGMKRRLSLGIALIQNPSVLILDEPTVGIDPELRLGIWNELYRLRNSEGKTIIITTHVMDEALKCDVLAMIRDGKVLTRGTPKALMQSYNVTNLEDVFIKAGGNLS
ncbi:ABC transporter ATP-binding protein [Pseudobacteroides cellulosolvens]|uniref:Sulfate-transporting ATPase n=1 Tax=Pseudobacteroides cellulosolvens ATCC 35603 = DSM 2933 TaxID=398512 RepID=A0A0L6JV15_9FIRM|nr:ABC transporter ATP-binding protein [Pseudobacteroides cellulosolvens]KNY29252.1 Sulfate-transporting ATPase [Pseudobacteroides cellulosolvens ATCC 35603 = DSM 2933]